MMTDPVRDHWNGMVEAAEANLETAEYDWQERDCRTLIAANAELDERQLFLRDQCGISFILVVAAFLLGLFLGIDRHAHPTPVSQPQATARR